MYTSYLHQQKRGDLSVLLYGSSQEARSVEPLMYAVDLPGFSVANFRSFYKTLPENDRSLGVLQRLFKSTA